MEELLGGKGIEAKTSEIKSFIMNDEKWNSIDYFLKFTKPIVDMLRSVDIDGSKLHLIDEMWDSMIEKVKKVIFEHEEENLISGRSNFFYPSYDILVVRWNKSNTPLHCMAFFDSQILSRIMASSREWDSRQAPNEAREISSNRIKCFKGENQFDIDETTNGLTELSIDEPQLKGVVFKEEVEEDAEEWPT
ncbi:hypothetical protein H5410_051368 [Solanum commersonii]|uniref:Uncharacterized protein n=1 Tax=Solanum commersonii TaxID=4109 RepID=A0A9J5WZT0_SOLCO|nr:hypothetical protein H5410_051368 [Solanum commersonii]